MTKEELINRANTGDTDAMMQLIKLFSDERDWNEAIDWADKAAEAGIVGAIYKAVVLHGRRMHALVDMGMVSGLMPDDAQAVKMNAALLLSIYQKGRLDLDDDTVSFLRDALRDGLYYEAVSCFFAKPCDYDRIISLLGDVEFTREQFLCGNAYYEKGQHNKAREKFNAALQDSGYIGSDKDTFDDCVFASSMDSFAAMERENGNMDQAVMLLNRAIDNCSTDEMKALLQKELGRYHRKMLGGWKYI